MRRVIRAPTMCRAATLIIPFSLNRPQGSRQSLPGSVHCRFSIAPSAPSGGTWGDGSPQTPATHRCWGSTGAAEGPVSPGRRGRQEKATCQGPRQSLPGSATCQGLAAAVAPHAPLVGGLLPDAPRRQAPRQQAPRQQAPRQQAPRQQAPRQQAPRQQAPRQRDSPPHPSIPMRLRVAGVWGEPSPQVPPEGAERANGGAERANQVPPEARPNAGHNRGASQPRAERANGGAERANENLHSPRGPLCP